MVFNYWFIPILNKSRGHCFAHVAKILEVLSATAQDLGGAFSYSTSFPQRGNLGTQAYAASLEIHIVYLVAPVPSDSANKNYSWTAVHEVN